ncbi:preprotein translocase subunit SecE [Blastococcus colisei]|uniref:Protein translocase subunit SecE n=1 Tax=Blastococcus colisei TaxID=1564162 RepID=A0A543PB57_9ACTN|nr:preprotein translocase subunit SecE [Blastococcus colisei]TQN41318.1 preprotein translocase subunit SecE [Blastococcus colisei]
MSDEKPGREDDPRDAELTDEQLDRETPGVDDAAELEAAEDELAAEAESDEDKVVTARATGERSRRGRITADGDDEDDEARPTRARRPAGARPATREGGGTRSRAAAERARTESGQKRSLARFLREVVAELRKVIWPGRRELITYTTVVIIFVAFVVALVAGLDLLFAQGVIAVFG